MTSRFVGHHIAILAVLAIGLFAVIYILSRKKISILRRILIALGAIVISGIIMIVILLMAFSVGSNMFQ